MADVTAAQDILAAMGMPLAQQNRMAAMTLIALCGLTPDSAWAVAKRRRCSVTKGIMEYVATHYGTNYAPNTRETFRRQVLHQFIHAGIAEYNPFEPHLPTNSPRAHYAVTESALRVVQRYGTADWQPALQRFLDESGALVERYERNRERMMVAVRAPDGWELRLSPGRHNEVQRAVIEEFAPRFAPGANLLYVGDTTAKDLVVDQSRLAQLRIPLTDHDKLPDVVLHDTDRDWLFLVEAVTSHGPISPSRLTDFESMLAACPAGAVYVSAFPDFKEFRRHMGNIAWETEVWLCDQPDHLIHYDGERFLGPRPRL